MLNNVSDTFIIACDRVGVSNRAAATIVSVALDDIEGTNAPVIDRNNVTRAREKARIVSAGSVDYGVIRSLYFDGRKTYTLACK